jgi:hypothetical protein
MPPTRTRNTDQGNIEKPTQKKNKKHQKFYKKPDGEKIPGVQKVKSSIRQTKRLLAKDNLAPDTRVETERRLEALEADLVKALTAKTERSNAVRYHKVKFFERQKVIRRINQAKKKLAEESSDTLPNMLSELRVDLNYVLHYPKSKPYISLFPPEARNHQDEENAPVSLPPNPERDAVRAWVREKMEAGELPTEPEKNLDSRGESKARSNDDWNDKVKATAKTKAKDKSAKKVKGPEIEEDEFFDAGSQQEENGEGQDNNASDNSDLD